MNNSFFSLWDFCHFVQLTYHVLFFSIQYQENKVSTAAAATGDTATVKHTISTYSKHMYYVYMVCFSIQA